MATKAVYDGPGVYDQPYQVTESREHVMNTIRLFGTQRGKLAYLDGLIAELTARRTRVANGTESFEEVNGPNTTQLSTEPMAF